MLHYRVVGFQFCPVCGNIELSASRLLKQISHYKNGIDASSFSVCLL